MISFATSKMISQFSDYKDYGPVSYVTTKMISQLYHCKDNQAIFVIAKMVGSVTAKTICYSYVTETITDHLIMSLQK